MTPLFIFSLPRSGSTLLQRVLAGHPQVSTAPEPWLLLPLAAMSGADDLRVYANYSQKTAQLAIDDFVARLPGGRDALKLAVRRMVQDLYDQVPSHGARYFLDKTPRYFLIIDYVLEVFPEASGIVLLRHPLDTLASAITTWGGDRLWLHHALVDLYRGPSCIQRAIARHGKRLLIVHYEDLVRSPETECARICSHLDLAPVPEMLGEAGSAAIAGRMGDPTAQRSDTRISPDSVGRWRSCLGTPLRRWFARRYLRKLGPEVISAFGIDLDALDRELGAIPVRWRNTLPDILSLAASFLGPRLAATVVRDQWRRKGSLPVEKVD